MALLEPDEGAAGGCLICFILIVCVVGWMIQSAVVDDRPSDRPVGVQHTPPSVVCEIEEGPMGQQVYVCEREGQ